MRNFRNYKFILGATAAVAIAAGFAMSFNTRGEPPIAARVTQENPQGIPIAKPAVEPEADLNGLMHIAIAAAPDSERGELAQIYEATRFAPAWVGSKRASKRAKMLWHAQMTAADHAIDAEPLGQLLRQIESTTKREAVASLDVAISIEALRLAQNLRGGAVPIEGLGDSWLMRTETVETASGLAAAIGKGEIETFYASLPPRDDQYRVLVSALGTYREFAAGGGWAAVGGSDELRLDRADPRVNALADRLAAEGYLTPEAKTDRAKLFAAVQAFQARNGLEPDGRIGKRTLAALNVSADDRVAQIAANMERRRHTPRDLGADFIAVNAAGVEVEVIRNGESQLKLRAITGTPSHATPILSAKVVGVTFNPRWDIPPSIASKEILAKLQKNPDYLAENNMVMVDAPSDDPSGQRHDWSQYSVKRFPVRLRQHPGDDNALGRIKLEMPNRYNIYLHDTPSRALFAKDDRHLSHGCVRVDQPERLAQNVLSQDGTWDAETITAAVATGDTRTVRLKTPLPVYIFYWTAFAESGVLNFREDAYGRDKPLAEKLGVRPTRNPRLLASGG